MEAREKTSELGHEEVVRIGRLLASAKGYRVLSSEGRFLGLLDHVRYERHSDHPDELVLRRRTMLWRRRRVVPFSAVEAVDPRAGTVSLRIDADAAERSPSP